MTSLSSTGFRKNSNPNRPNPICNFLCYNHLKLLEQEVLLYQRVAEGLLQGLKLDNFLKLVLRLVCQKLKFRRAGIYLLDADAKQIRLALGISGKGNFQRNRDKLPIKPKHSRKPSPIADLINGCHKYYLNNNIPNRLSKFLGHQEEVFNCALVPLQGSRGKTIGLLAVDNLNVYRPITRNDMTSLLHLGIQVGLAIETLREHDSMVNLSMTDSLTGLYNRRYFDHALSQEIKRCQRYERAFSLLLIDIDRFKRINDTYGHNAGDNILRQVAVLLKSNLRGLEVVTRIGGDEFAVILPETPPHNLSVVVKRLLHEMRTAKPEIQTIPKRKEKITFSIGQATFKGGNTNTHGMIRLADKSLYQAKHNGRNQVGNLRLVLNKTKPRSGYIRRISNEN
jgi:diguanylate cyclase (GGDEF)-like protein